MNSILFAKTLVRKDVASSAPPPKSDKDKADATAAKAASSAAPSEASGSATLTPEAETKPQTNEDDFSSKAQIMTLMTTDVDRVSEFAWHMFSLIGTAVLSTFLNRALILSVETDSPIEIVIGSIFLYSLLGEQSLYFHLASSTYTFIVFRCQ